MQTHARSCFNRNPHLYRSNSLLEKKTDTQGKEVLSLIPTPSPNRHVSLLFYFPTSSHIIKDCPLAVWHCWLKWSRSNYCNKEENSWGAYLQKRNPYTSAQEGDCSLNIRLTVPLWQPKKNGWGTNMREGQRQEMWIRDLDEYSSWAVDRVLSKLSPAILFH